MKKIWIGLLISLSLMTIIACHQLLGEKKMAATDTIHKLKSSDKNVRAPSESIQYVILVIGDGMQLEHEIAASQYMSGKPASLSFHQLPFKAHMTTWDATTYNRFAWIKGVAPYDPETFTPGLAYDVFAGGLSPYPLNKPWSKETDYLLQRAVAYGEYDFSLDTFPHDYKKKFYMCTDSAAAATAMATGRKTEAGNISWDYGGKDGAAYGKSILDGDPEYAPFQTICEMLKAQKNGFFGTVSTVPFNHATPAAFISHNPDRNNYYQGRHPWYHGKGLAESIFNDVQPDVVIGAGFPKCFDQTGSGFSSYISTDLYYQITNNLTSYVMAGPQKSGNGYFAPQYKTIEAAVSDINNVHSRFYQSNLVALYGLNNWTGPFAADDCKYTRDLDGTIPMYSTDPLTESDPMEGGMPNLEHAAIQAIKLLLYRSVLNDDKPFFLMVEQGDIDWANHYNDYRWMLGTMWELNKTVHAICRYIDSNDRGENANQSKTKDRMNWHNTLLIVTSDHGNSYMRLQRDQSGNVILKKGQLPIQTPTNANTGGGQYPYRGNFTYSDEVTYGSDYHTNELVMLYASGSAAPFLSKYQGTWYPKTKILDNTQLFWAMADALQLIPEKRTQ